MKRWHISICIILALFAMLAVISPNAVWAAPNVAGKWHADWMARYLYIEQNGSSVTGRCSGANLSGTLQGNTWSGTWVNTESGLANQFEIVFSNDGNIITGGFWDRGKGYAYTREKNIRGKRVQ